MDSPSTTTEIRSDTLVSELSRPVSNHGPQFFHRALRQPFDHRERSEHVKSALPVFTVVNMVFLDLDGPAALEQPTITDLAKIVLT
jgi:hypothetical protein